MESTDPTDPMESTEPTDPIDRIEPREPIESTLRTTTRYFRWRGLRIATGSAAPIARDADTLHN